MEKELEIYYDHYKDTFSWLRKYLDSRDRYFKYLVFLLAILVLNSSLPSDFAEVTQVILKKNIGVSGFSNFMLIDSLLLFSILSVSIKYFQFNLLIERQYPYLHHIEKKLSRKLKNFNVFREGKAYLNHYPIFSSIVHRIYTIAFPILLVTLVTYKWLYIIESVNKPGFFWFDTIVSLFIIILTLCYMAWVHFGDFKKCRKMKMANKAHSEEAKKINEYCTYICKVNNMC